MRENENVFNTKDRRESEKRKRKPSREHFRDEMKKNISFSGTNFDYSNSRI